MFGSNGLILTLAMICQLPGGDCPVPETPAAGQVRQWVDAPGTASTQPMRIWGWVGADGRPRFNPLEYPALAREIAAQAAPRPKPQAPTAPAYPPTGVVLSKIPAIGAGQTWHGGNVVGDKPGARGEARPPDAYLTLIGEKVDRQRVAAKLKADPSFREAQERMGDRLAVHSYPADAVMVKNVGLPDGGRPDVVLQDATGGEVRRWHSDPDPAEAAQAVRKLDPGYRPGGESPPAAEGPWTKAGVVIGAVIVAILGCAALSGRPRWNTRS